MARTPKTTTRRPRKRSLPPLRLEWWAPDCLSDDPLNWRRHGDKQLSALKDVLEEVGWAGALLYNERTQRLIDGHARKQVSSGKVPVLVGSWTEEQERKILATLDPLGALAETDAGKLDTLLREVSTGSAALGALLEEIGGCSIEQQIDELAHAKAANAAASPSDEDSRSSSIYEGYKSFNLVLTIEQEQEFRRAIKQ